MKIISLTCPSCGARLEMNSGLKQGTCNYCGASFLIEEEKKKLDIEDLKSAGYEFERGRIDAQNEGADPKLIKSLGALLDPVSYLPSLKQKEGILARHAESAQKKLETLEKESTRIITTAGTGAAGLLLCIMSESAIPALVGILGEVLMYFLYPNYVGTKRGEAERAAGRLEDCRRTVYPLRIGVSRW